MLALMASSAKSRIKDALHRKDRSHDSCLTAEKELQALREASVTGSF
jgi:hypothetical protein